MNAAPLALNHPFSRPHFQVRPAQFFKAYYSAAFLANVSITLMLGSSSAGMWCRSCK
jgi:hypothetical protein